MFPILPILVLMIILVPRGVEAAISITEVAWMGSLSSPNHEWIELYNASTVPVDVTDWTLADGDKLLITLTGSIPPQQHVVLERTSDSSAPGTAFLIYTGALVNTGSTLTLRRSDGAISDQVIGGSDWSLIGGDNTTKATAQRNGTVWSTGNPTPGSATISSGDTTSPATDTNPPVTTVPTGSSGVSTTPTARSVRQERGGSSSAIPLVKAKTELALAITAPTVVYERQPMKFVAVPSGIGRTIIDSLTLTWNFGDFTTATGTSVQHRFRYPGTYVVTLRGTFGRHDTLTRHTVTVLPVMITAIRSEEGLFIANNSVYDVDVSGFVVRSGTTQRTFPPYSYLAAKQSVRIPGTVPEPVTIFDDRGQQVYTEGGTQIATSEVPEVVTEVTLRPNQADGWPVVQKELTDEVGSQDPQLTESAYSGEEMATVTLATTVGALSFEMVPNPSPRWPLGLLGVVLVLAVGAVVWPRERVVSPRVGSGSYEG
jgi:hypothetical protein